MTGSTERRTGPVRMSWRLGLLTLAAVVVCGTVLPGVVVWSLGGSPRAAGSAMVGGFAVCWFGYLGILRRGIRRGWWV